MPRSPFDVHLVDEDDRPLGNTAPAPLVKQEFARRLMKRMTAKGWSQSELARRAKERINSDASIGRSSISQYINGVCLPGPVHLDAICQALDCKPDDLLPTRLVPAPGPKITEMEFKDLGDGEAWIAINQRVPWDVAIDLVRVIHKHMAEKRDAQKAS